MPLQGSGHDWLFFPCRSCVQRCLGPVSPYIKVLAIFSGWHPLINWVQTSGFFKTPDSVLKRKPSDGYRKTGKGGAPLDILLSFLAYSNLTEENIEGWPWSTCLVKAMNNIWFQLAWSEAIVSLRPKGPPETVNGTVAQFITAEVDLTKAPNIFERVSYGPETCSERKEGNTRIREQVKQTSYLTQTSHWPHKKVTKS